MTAIGPAHSFLHTTPITQWSIVNYLSTHRAAIILDFDHLCADWVRELTRINDLPPAESSTHRRNAARNLLKRYKSKVSIARPASGSAGVDALVGLSTAFELSRDVATVR